MVASLLFAYLTFQTAVAQQPLSQPTSANLETSQESYFVSISINDVEIDGIYPVFAEGEEFFIETGAFFGLGMVEPNEQPVTYRGRSYVRLSAVPGLSFEFASGMQHLALTCQPNCFPSSRLTGVRQLPPADPTPFGAFLNYDLLAEKSGSNDFLGTLAEVGVFSNYGSGTLTLSGRDFTGDARVVRLDSSWTIDRPEKRQRLRFGDSVTQHGGWGRAVRFGGIQFGTDFGLQPGFISFPTPTISGGAALPSTAEIFVNGIRRASVDIDPGAFTIEQPPVITGSGNLLVVVRDLLGRETILSRPFYASRSLLRPDLEEYSIEAGFLRKNYGRRSNDYSEAFIAGSYRRGFNSKFTGGVHGELSGKRVGIGPYIDWQAPFGGILSGAAAFSMQDGKLGALFQLDFNWDSQSLGINAANEWISGDFTRLGNIAGEREPRMRTSVNFGVEVSENSSLSLNYLRVDERKSANLQVASANYSIQVGDVGSLTANVSHSFGEVQDTSIFLVFTARLAERTTGSTSLERGGGRWTGTARVHRSAASDGGLSYRGEVSFDGKERLQAGASYDTRKGIVSVDHSEFNGKNTTRVGLRGGMAFFGGGAFLTNTVDDSFALVKVSDYQGVGVLRDNRPAGKTNENGQVFISRLRPYEENLVSIDPLDLPLTADIGALVLKPVPRRRSGVIIEFPIERTVAAILRLVDNDGIELLPGTLLRADETGAIFYVGFKGAVYVTGLNKPITLRAETAGGDCAVRLDAMKPASFPTRLGTLVCNGDGS